MSGKDVMMTGFAVISGQQSLRQRELGGEEEHPDLPSLSVFLLHQPCGVSPLWSTDLYSSTENIFPLVLTLHAEFGGEKHCCTFSLSCSLLGSFGSLPSGYNCSI